MVSTAPETDRFLDGFFVENRHRILELLQDRMPDRNLSIYGEESVLDGDCVFYIAARCPELPLPKRCIISVPSLLYHSKWDKISDDDVLSDVVEAIEKQLQISIKLRLAGTQARGA